MATHSTVLTQPSALKAMPPASRYWADWDPSLGAQRIIRKDTRVFWEPQTIGTVGRCIGSFWGENPDGAESIYTLAFAGYSPIQHGCQPGDPTLRLIFDIWQLCVSNGIQTPKSDDYIEILNLYYFRNPQSQGALQAWCKSGGMRLYHQLPSPSSQFALLGWGVQASALPQAIAAGALLKSAHKVIIPDSAGNVHTCSGSKLSVPISPGPVQPSFISRRSKSILPSYRKNVASAIWP